MVIGVRLPVGSQVETSSEVSKSERRAEGANEETIGLMRRIKPTNWNVWKTEAIDFKTSFLWFDDNCFDFEKDVLRKHGVLDNWIEVDLAKDVYQLKKFLTSFPLSLDIQTII